MRRQRLQFGGVFLNKQRGIWYYRRTVNGKRKLTPIGKLAEFPTKALAKEEAKNLIKANSNQRWPALRSRRGATWAANAGHIIRLRPRVTATI
jgi:hypothetical protein